MVLLGQCTEACGWVAAICAALSWGSFGVPIKGQKATSLNIDPLVMQSYKNIMCFLTCWLVIPLGEPFSFTPWGIVSGIFWVPGATCGIYGIRQAGLAISVGTWSSLIVVSSFCWGILVFHEEVKSIPGAFCAMLMLCAGLGGMSRYSHPPKKEKIIADDSTVGTDKDIMDDGDEPDEEMVPLKVDSADSEKVDQVGSGKVSKRKAIIAAAPQAIDVEPSSVDVDLKASPASTEQLPLEIESLPLDDTKKHMTTVAEGDKFVLFQGRVVLTRRQVGILGAVVNGTWGGTNMIPLHYAKKQGYGGAGFVISFAVGSMLVLIVVWILRYLFNLYRLDFSHKNSWRSLPSFHLREMWLPGFLSGTLYSIGNFSSIIATHHLGQGVGYSVCQSAMLVSGIWGIFFFGEVQGIKAICKWFGAATITLIGILWLSYEHKGEAAHRL